MTTGKTHWVVRLNWRNRSLSFLLAFIATGTHLHAIDAGFLPWGLLALHLLAFPQLAYWRARRSSDPLRAEMQNLLLDGALFGAWCAYWGMPLWISFMFFICACVNLMIFEGLPGLLRALAACLAGIVPVVLAHGFRFRPDTSLVTSLLCIGVLSGYLLAFAFGAYRRGIALRESGVQLRARLEEITRLQARLQEQAARDPLTGLFNRRHFDRALADALARCQREGEPLALAITDIDHFKAVNDRHGHLAGDEVLRGLAELLAARVGETGMACRFGGEEFVLLLPGMTAVAAREFSDTLRLEFESMRASFDGLQIGTTLSFGIAAAPAHAVEAHALLRLADDALYAAKLHGRNRVVLARTPAPDAIAAAEA